MIASYQPIDSDSAGRSRRLVNGRRRETRCDLCGEWTAGIGAHRGGMQCCSDWEARGLTEAGFVRVPVVKGAVDAVRRVAGEPCLYLTGYKAGGPRRRPRRTSHRWVMLPEGWEMGPSGPRPLATYEAPPAINQAGGACWTVELIGRGWYAHPLSPRYIAYSLCGTHGHRVGWGHLYRTGLTAAPDAKRAALISGCYLL